jgi:hypothetical protein
MSFCKPRYSTVGFVVATIDRPVAYFAPVVDEEKSLITLTTPGQLPGVQHHPRGALGHRQLRRQVLHFRLQGLEIFSLLCSGRVDTRLLCSTVAVIECPQKSIFVVLVKLTLNG